MNFTLDTVLFIFLIQLLAFIVKWLIGFGDPLISAPLLSMQLDNTLITPGTLLPSLCINASIIWQNRKLFNWRRILPLLLCMLLGDIPGTWLLQFSLPWILKTVLGVVVLFLGVEMATRDLRPVRPNRKDHLWAQYVISFFSGMCSALFGINMFLLAYLQRTAKDYEEFRGSICFLFFGETLFRTILYAYTGLLNGDAIIFGLISLAGAMVSRLIARLLSSKVQGARLQKLAIVFFILGGVSITLKSLIFHT